MATDTWGDVLDRVAYHLAAAGRTITPPITDVRLGEPAGVAGRQVAYWYDGDGEGQLIGHTLTRASYTERLTIRWYWPVGDRQATLAGAIERQLRQAARATWHALWADEQLGGACAGLHATSDTQAGWVEAGGGWVRTCTIGLGIEMPDLDIIAVE